MWTLKPRVFPHFMDYYTPHMNNIMAEAALLCHQFEYADFYKTFNKEKTSLHNKCKEVIKNAEMDDDS